jgi:hypothetical protein
MALPTGSTSSVAGAGYKALSSGSPGTFNLNFFLGAGASGAEAYRGLSIAIPTSATSPVQSANQNLTGGTITLGADPTEGNMLVLVRMIETGNFLSVPTGYSLIASGSFVTSSPGSFFIDICVKCAQADEPAVQVLVDASFSHWQSLSEWALT